MGTCTPQDSQFCRLHPTPPFPTLAFAQSGPHQVSPHLHFYPVFDLRKAPTGMTDPTIVPPPPEDGIDTLNPRLHGLADVLPEDFPELGKERRAFLHLRHKLRSPPLVTAQNEAIFKSQACEASPFC